MTTTNKPQENTENQQNKSMENPSILYKLTQNSINRYIRTSQKNQISALGYLDGDDAKLDIIRKELLKTIISERGAFPKKSDEANISETDIAQYLCDTSRIRRMILDETVMRRSLEKNVWNTLEKRYPKNSLKASQTIIVNVIQNMDDTTLRQVLSKRDFGHEKLIDQLVNPTPLWRDLDELTQDLGISGETLTDSPSLKYSLEEYIKTGYMGTSDIEELIQSQTNLSIDNKRKILSFFIPTIPIHMLESMGISVGDKQKKAEEIINSLLVEQGKITSNQSIYDILPTEDIKEEIRTWIQYVDGLTVSTSELSDASIDKFFDKQSSILADAIADHMDVIGQQEKLRTISSLSQFKSRIKKELIDQNGNCLIPNIDTLTNNSYIIADAGSAEEKTWKVLSYDAIIGGSGESSIRGFSLEGFHSNGSSLGMAANTEYDVIFNAFRDKVKNGSIAISIDKPSYINSNESDHPFSDFDGFMAWVNTIDPSNKSKKIENGMSFAVTIDGQIQIYRIEGLDANKNSFSLRDKYNHIYKNPRITLEGFYEGLRGDSGYFGFRRLGDVSTLEKFAASTSIDGIIYEDHQLLIDDSDGHNSHSDSHGHANNKKKPVWGFENENGNVIETQFDGDLVTIFEYQPYQESKKNADGKRKVDKKMKGIEYSQMTLEGLQAFLTEHKFTRAVGENPHTKIKEEIHDEVHPHFHGRSPLSMFMGMKNFADISKAFSMGTHMITHMLEEQSKMHAAEAMYGFFEKTLGKDHALTMHALMEFSGDIGKAIDDKVAYLKRLAGLPRRKEIKHILLTRPAKPHDILAALIVTAEMAGHLYPDSELQELQGGQYIWFDSVCLALGFDPKDELKKAQDKEANKNAETSDHMHETTLLTRFFKLHQDDSPYIQAIAGGSKFWNAVSSGRSAQSDKGKKEGGEFLGAMDRAEYVVSKMESNEPEIAMGAYPSIYAKDPSAKNLGPAFVWALSNFPNSSHPETSNTFKNMMDGNGVAFHALPFCRNKANSNIYKKTMDTLIHSLAHKDPGKYQSMSNAWDKTKAYRPMGEYTFQEDHIRELWLFWKNYNSLLHPILQLTDPYVFTLIADEHTKPGDKSILSSYVDKLGTTVTEGRLNDTGPDDNIMKMGGYRFDGGSMIVDIDPSDKQKSVNRLLNYIHIGQNGDIGNVHQREQIWNGQIVSYIESMRKNENFINNPDLQESQFIKIHDEIMHFLRQKIVERYFSGAEKQDYIRQLSQLGFDMSKENIHQKELPGKPVDFHGKEAFRKFKSGTRTASEGVQLRSHQFATELLNTPATDSFSRQSA